MEKRCVRCKKTTDISCFDEYKKGKDGYYSQCKQCKTSDKKYNNDNREKINEKARIYYKENYEECRQRSDHYNIENKEQRAIYDQQYRKDNKQKIQLQQAEYYQTHKEETKKYDQQHNQQKAKYKTYHDKLIIEQAPRLAQDGISIEVKCEYCGQYFIPANLQLRNKIQQIKQQAHGSNLYCSEQCKISNQTPLTSKAELEIQEFVKSLTSDVLTNDRTQILNSETDNYLELDIYLPTLNKAIEYNGMY